MLLIKISRRCAGKRRGKFLLRRWSLATLVVMKHSWRIFAGIIALSASVLAADNPNSEEGFVKISDGTCNGWKIANENTNSWKIRDGAFVANGNRSHLYYVGDGKAFKDFELKVDVMTEPNSNGGIYFHTKFQPDGWPKGGFECQVNNTQGDWIKTGSLYGLVNVATAFPQDKKWWTQHITVKGNSVTVRVDGKIVLQYNEPAGATAGKDFERKLGEGTFAFQAHDPGSTVYYKNVRVKRL